MVNTYLISFDIPKENYEDYSRIFDAIKKYESWAQITENTWAVSWEMKATDIRNSLQDILPVWGRLFVIKSGREAAWKNVLCKNEWLKENL